MRHTFQCAPLLVRALLLLGAAPMLGSCLSESRAAEAGECTSAAAAAASSGQLLVASQEGIISLIDLASGAVTRLDDGGELHGAAVSPDGRWGVVTDYGRRRHSEYPARVFDGNTLIIIDMAQRRIARRINVGEHRGVHDIAFLPGSSSRVVVTAQGNREIILVDLGSGAVTAAVDTRGEGSHSLDISVDGRTVYTANEEEETVSRIDLASGALSGHLQVGANPLGVAVTLDGSELWVGSRDEAVHVLDTQTGAKRTKLDGMGFVDDLKFTPDGRRAVVLDGRGGTLRLIDVASRRVLGSVALPRPSKVALSPEGRAAFVSLYRDAAVAVVDLEALCVVRRFSVGRNPDGIGWSSLAAARR